MNYSRPTAFLIIALLIPNLLAQDTAAIKRQLQQLADEWQMHFDNRDATALAKLYAVDCDVLHDDQPRSSRAEVQVEYEQHFSDNPNVTTEFHDVKHRVLSDSVAIESGIWTEANFTMFSTDGEKVYSGLFEPIEEGYRYTIDGNDVNYFRRK